ncbi:MAG: hypothetical protein AAB444_00945 [Patescibacteria group bacterium]
MKLSKLFHVLSVIVGLAGVATFMTAVFGGADNIVFGITKLDALLCAGILMLIAIWAGIGTIHHMIIEKNGEMI